MPIIKSAKKRVKVARKATVRNAKTKRSLKAALKAFAGKASADSHSSAQSALDKAGKKGVMHKNKVARKKRQLAKAAKAAGVKTAGTATKKKAAPAKKPAAKKPAAKKAPQLKKK
jgi:ribosomal protein S20